MSTTIIADAGWCTQTGQILHRWLRTTIRQAWGPALSLIQPVIWILLFGQVYAALGALPRFGDVGYLSYLVPGVLMMTVLYSGAWAGAGHLEDLRSGVLDHLLASPVRRSSIVVGQLIQQLIVNAIQSAVVLGIGWLAGARIPGGAAGIGIALVAATLLATLFCSLSTAVALQTRSQVALIGISQTVVLPATFLSTAMMPADLLPDWVRAVAEANPLTWAVELGRSGLAGTLEWWPTAGRAIGLAVLAAAALGWAVWSLETTRRRA